MHMSALLLDDALLKCVFTEVVLFSVVALNTLAFHISQGSVATHLRCGGIVSVSVITNILILTVSEISLKIFNSLFDEVMAWLGKQCRHALHAYSIVTRQSCTRDAL